MSKRSWEVTNLLNEKPVQSVERSILEELIKDDSVANNLGRLLLSGDFDSPLSGSWNKDLIAGDVAVGRGIIVSMRVKSVCEIGRTNPVAA